MDTLTPEQEARIALATHCFDCPDCKTEWNGDTPVRRQCPAADDLSEELKRQQRRPPGLFCGRCGQPVLGSEEYETQPIHSGSGAGATVYLHKRLCVKARFQSTDRSIRH